MHGYACIHAYLQTSTYALSPACVHMNKVHRDTHQHTLCVYVHVHIMSVFLVCSNKPRDMHTCAGGSTQCSRVRVHMGSFHRGYGQSIFRTRSMDLLAAQRELKVVGVVVAPLDSVSEDCN